MATTPIISDKKVLVNSIDISEFIQGLTINTPLTGMKTATIIANKYSLDYSSIPLGGEIEIFTGQYGDTLTRKFYGTITSKNETLIGITINCNDDLWKASGKTITRLYDIEDPNDMFGGDIRLLMIDVTKEGGLIATDDTIDQTSVIVPQVVCDNVKAIQKMSELAKILYWDYWQEPISKNIYFTNPENYPTYPITLEVGNNVLESPEYNDNIYQTINEVEIQGIRTYPTVSETFTGNGVNKTFTVTKSPIMTYVKVTVNGVLKTGAVEGSSGSYDYLVNLQKGIINFVTAPGAVSIIIEYTATEIVSVLVEDADSKNATRGTRKLVVANYIDSATVGDATQRGYAILNEHKNNFPNFKVKTFGIEDLTPRFLVNFSDPFKDKSYTGLSIVNISDSWPKVSTEITLGKNTLKLDKLLMSTEERVKKLERVRREGILLNVNKLFNNEFYFVIDGFEVLRENTDTSKFILDDATLGKFDLQPLDEGATGTMETIIKRRWKWNSYSELSAGTYDGNINIYNDKIELI